MALDIISTINLDLKRPNTETVYAVQYDTAGRIKAQLTNDGEAWHVPSSAGGMVSFRKSDNIGGFYDTTELGEVAVSVDENDDSIIYIALDAQTTITETPLDHPVQMQINFYNSQGKRLSTFAFYLRVQASVLFDGNQDERPVASEWTFRILTGALGQTIKNQEEAIKWMEDNIRTQEGYVVDDTLKVEGAAGDAKKIGELFEEIVKVSDSMPGYFPTTDTERVGSTEYYTRSGTAPNYVYTKYTGATLETGVTYYEYSPWNRIWIDPDDNDVVIPTMDDHNELSRQISDVQSAFDKVATLQGIKPVFVFGVYVWNPLHDAYAYQANQKRACAQLKDLSLSQGDTVGITDYTTYSIAFGDNFNGWYNGGYQSHDITANNATILPYVFLAKRNDDADMTENDLTTLANQFHSTGATGEKVIFTEAAIDDIRARTGAKNGYVHLSFDDVGYCFIDLANNSFSSVWDEPFFGKLKELHDSYGAVFSLYVWDISNLASLPNKYRSELSDASEWVNFGFHAVGEGSLANASYSDAKAAYDTFIADVFDKIGGVNSVDRMPRLNYFAGNLDAIKALRDADCGCIGFLNTDDSRNTYYLSADELAYLRTHSIWTDRTNGLQFVSTVMRLDWFVDGFSSQYNYNVPVKSNPYDELVYRYGQSAMADLYSGLVVFTHEWQIYSSNYVLNAAMVSMVEQVCRFANDYKYDFDYPQNRVENITSYAVGEIVIDNFTTTVRGEWSFGAVEDSGNIVSSEIRICTTPFKASKVVVSFPSGYKVNVCRYNSVNADSTSFVDRTNWQTSKQSLTGDYYYVIVASTTENTASLDIADLYTITAVRNINDL